MNLKVPHLKFEQIRKKASEFLNQFHPSGELPIPIEKIIDVKLGIDIFPIPNLWKNYQLSGFLSHDLSTIYVDEFQAEHFEEKYRFTLAHEIGHYELHKELYESLSFKSEYDYIEWRLSISHEDLSWFETHGNWFAGQVLVPTKQLIKICKEVVQKNQKSLANYPEISDDELSYVSNEIASYFEVNPAVVEIRIKREKISQLISSER